MLAIYNIHVGYYIKLTLGTRQGFFRRGKRSCLFPFFQKLKCQQHKIWKLVFSITYLVSAYPIELIEHFCQFCLANTWMRKIIPSHSNSALKVKKVVHTIIIYDWITLTAL